MRELQALLEQHHGARICGKTVSRTSRGMKYVSKRVFSAPAERNFPATIAARRTYAEHAKVVMLDPKPSCLFSNEFGVNRWMRASYGRARRGKPGIVRVPQGGRSENISVCFAIDTVSAVPHVEARVGALNGSAFAIFIRTLIAKITESAAYASYDTVHITMNNAPFHHRAEIRSLFTDTIRAWNLPPRLAPQCSPSRQLCQSTAMATPSAA